MHLAIPANQFMLKGNDSNARKRYEMSPKLTIKIPITKCWQ